MEIMQFVLKNLNYKERSGKIVISVLYGIFFFNLLFMVLTQKEKNYNILFVSLLFIIIIHIWIYVAPKFDNDFSSLGDLFINNNEYKNEYEKNKNRVYLLSLKESSINCKVLKIVYIMFGIAMLAFNFYYIFSTHLMQIDVYNYFFVILILISLVLNYSSFYTSILFTYFIRQVSNLNNLNYNIFIPSATYEFVELKKDADKISIVFLVMALLYNISYMILLFENNHNSLCPIIGIGKQLLFSFFLFFSILSFFSVFLLPKFFLHRLLYRWKRKALNSFQKEYYNAQRNNSSLVQLIVQNIERLNNDNMKYGLVNLLEILLIITTILYNIIFIYSQKIM